MEVRSEDDFDGYLDMKSNDEAYTNKRRDGAVEGDEERTKKEDVLMHLSMVCPTLPLWGYVGIGWGFVMGN